MDNDFSALKSIQELKNLLDSGAINQQEYEVLKRKIIFGNNNASSPAPSPAVPITPTEAERPRPTIPPTPFTAPGNPHPVAGNPLTPEYRHVPNANSDVDAAGVKARNIASENSNDNDRLKSLTFNQPEEVTEVKRKDWLLTILISLAVVLLIGLVAYQLFSDSESERLTSISGPDTEEAITGETANTNVATTTPEPNQTATAPDTQPQGTTLPTTEPAPAATPETGTTPANQTSAATETTPAPAPVAVASKITEEEALNKIKDRLQTYYNDIKDPPFAAQNHFASTVERYYTLVGTTPQAINENISSYHFNEFQDSQSSIEDGSIKMVNSGDNGYEVTYIEHGTAFRKSKGQKQETTARVRAKFDQNFKMTYFRQEQLLENKFIEE